MRTLSVYSYAFSRLFGYLPYYNKGKKLLEQGKQKEFENQIMKTCVKKAVDTVLKKAGARLDIVGQENIPEGEPVAFVCNHQGNLDAVVLLAISDGRRLGFIAKKEIEKVKILEMWMKLIGCTFIDRKSPRNAIIGINEAIENIKNGTSMGFFPEGTRSKSDDVAEFKTGVFKVVEKAKVKVIPVAINGTYKLMEANGGKIKPADVKVTICKPIDTKDFTKDDFKKLPNEVRDIIINNMRLDK